MTGQTTAIAPTAPPALDQILSRILDHSNRLRDILTNAQAFISRTLGEDTPAEPGADTPKPQGMLGGIDAALGEQSRLINDLRDAVNILEKIG